jgi:DNA invertase Pin-like site-specific DNA recombinase
VLHRTFDPKKPFRVVLYLRMSTAQQNPRSPDQQRDTIEATFRRLGYPWVVVAVYTDAGISGRYVGKRPEFQRMLREIRTGAITVDAVLVDTYERFGRAEELANIRQELYRHHGVVVLTADSSFADPTSTSGQILAACESVRATDDNRVKAHNVLRGKRDEARRKHWPGGPPPFGYTLRSVLVERDGRQEVDHCVLVPDPAAAAVITDLFRRADQTGEGCLRLTRWLNDDSSVPEAFKPFTSAGVNDWLANPIYKGELVWERYATGVVDDRRVLEKNPDDRVVRVPGFCEPLVPLDVWDRVQQLREARGAAVRKARASAPGPEKHITPLVPGVALKYPLSGLVVCGRCGLSMSPSSSPAYTTKGTGESKRYTAYHCGRAADRICPNTTRVPEAWLREAVLGLVRDRLLPTGGAPWTAARLEEADWFAPLLAQIQSELDRQAGDRTDRRPALASEITRLEQQIAGWKLSLGNPGLDSEIRGALETDLGTALGRVRSLKAELATATATATDARLLADPAAVADRLNRFAEVLAFDNPSRLNVELALHIDAIECFPDGRVVVRTCKLGALTPVAEAMSTLGETPTPDRADDAACRGTPRKRSIRRLQTEDAGPALRDVAHRAADVKRFAGLGSEWFWEDEFRIPEPTCWSKENAAAVARARSEGRTHEQLADQFGVTVPTIRKALEIAAQSDAGLARLPRKMARARWQDSHADEVWALRQQGRSMKELAAHFDVSEPLIRAALKIVADRAGPTETPTEPPPSGSEVE